jgi:copper chaperone CopZ
MRRWRQQGRLQSGWRDRGPRTRPPARSSSPPLIPPPSRRPWMPWSRRAFYGESSDDRHQGHGETGAKGEKVQTLKVQGVHLCCPSCVKAVNKALADVPGVTGQHCRQRRESFEVTGDFKDSDVFDALQKAGLTGKVGNNEFPPTGKVRRMRVRVPKSRLCPTSARWFRCRGRQVLA